MTTHVNAEADAPTKTGATGAEAGPQPARWPRSQVRMPSVRLPRLLFRLNEHLTVPTRLSPHAMLTLLVLAQSMGPDGHARISQSRVGARIGLRTKTAADTLLDLANKGLVEIRHPPGGVGPAAYDLSPTFEALERIVADAPPVRLDELTRHDPKDAWVMVPRGETAQGHDEARDEGAMPAEGVATRYVVASKGRKDAVDVMARSDEEALGIAVMRHANAFRGRRGARPTVTVTKDGTIVARMSVKSRTTNAGTATWSASIDLATETGS